uniref:NADH dehydrogenase [ubiquinone] 1 alpha subcomplex subunit 5 n=1 Tax=Myotis lucifugus TaxID=59463 RepID=G1Q3H4_MYOLU
MAGLLKTTGLPGRAACESPQERLSILYTKILDSVSLRTQGATYRKYTEEITNEKLDMVKAKPDVRKLEDRFQGGQIEEVILQAENVLSLVRTMIRWKPWEPLVQ